MTIKELESKYNVKVFKKNDDDSHRGSWYSYKKDGATHMSKDFYDMNELAKDIMAKVKPKKKYVVKIKRKEEK